MTRFILADLRRAGSPVVVLLITFAAALRA